jgi:hypothetical protein
VDHSQVETTASRSAYPETREMSAEEINALVLGAEVAMITGRLSLALHLVCATAHRRRHQHVIIPMMTCW